VKEKHHERNGGLRAGPPRRRTTLRDNLESIALAIILVLAVRQVLAEAFRIEHGSMAPTLAGKHREMRCPNCDWVFRVGQKNVMMGGEAECPNCRWIWPAVDGAARMRRPAVLWNSGIDEHGRPLLGNEGANRVERGPSRVFVDKTVYRRRPPRRWEVVVFLHNVAEFHCRDCDNIWSADPAQTALCPACGSDALDILSKDYIKRCIGLPGETVLLRDGDVYINGVLERKPDRVQRELWMHVFDTAYWPRRDVPAVGEPFAWGPDAALWQPVEACRGAFRLDARGRSQPVLAAFNRTITDFYAYDGLSFGAFRSMGSSGRHVVGDVRLSARVRVRRAEPGAAVVLRVVDNGVAHELRADAAGTTLSSAGAVQREAPDRLPTDRPVSLTLENYDNRVVVRMDGRELFRYHHEGGGGGPNGVQFGAAGMEVDWERVVIQRDIYYMAGDGNYKGGPFTMEPGRYFVLGDNSPRSSDSRSWPAPGVAQDYVIGKAFFVFWPAHHMKWLVGGGAVAGGPEAAH
jgi:signal peptidase I